MGENVKMPTVASMCVFGCVCVCSGYLFLKMGEIQKANTVTEMEYCLYLEGARGVPLFFLH